MPSKLSCPACHAAPMLTIDVGFPMERCPGCCGIWLYTTEMQALQVQHPVAIQTRKGKLGCTCCPDRLTEVTMAGCTAFRCVNHGIFLPREGRGLLPEGLIHELEARDAVTYWEVEAKRRNDELEDYSAVAEAVRCSWYLLRSVARFVLKCVTIVVYGPSVPPDDENP